MGVTKNVRSFRELIAQMRSFNRLYKTSPLLRRPRPLFYSLIRTMATTNSFPKPAARVASSRKDVWFARQIPRQLAQH